MSKDTGFSITSAERYSLALYELSNESNLLTQIEEQCSSVLELINTSDDFKNLIKDPTTKQDDLLKIIISISENYKFETLLKNFLNFLIQKRRFFFLEKILLSFIEICSKKRGEIKAELLAANDLNKEEIIKIENDLSSSFDSKIKLNFKKEGSFF